MSGELQAASHIDCTGFFLPVAHYSWLTTFLHYCIIAACILLLPIPVLAEKLPF